MKVRTKKDLGECFSTNFNTSTFGEVIVHFDDGSADSMFISELDVYLKSGWKDMRQAFKDRDLIPDNLNTCFFEPLTPEDRQRGFVL